MSEPEVKTQEKPALAERIKRIEDRLDRLESISWEVEEKVQMIQAKIAVIQATVAESDNQKIKSSIPTLIN